MAKTKLKNKIFSIIIRGNDKAHWLKILFKKLFTQKEKNFEIIFGNNNSKDETTELLKYYKIKKNILIKNYKPGFAINKCLKYAEGKYTIIISSHCVPLNNNWLTEYLNFMEKNLDIVAAFGKQIPLPGTSTKDQLDLNIVFRNETTITKNDAYFNNANSIYRTSFLKKNLFNNSVSNIEDRLWAKKINKNGNLLAYTASSPVFHIDGIHQHKLDSIRSEKSLKLINKDYLRYWKKCDFLKSSYHNYTILINARRCKNSKTLIKKIQNLLNHKETKKLKISKIIIDTNLPIKDKKIGKISIKIFKPTGTFGDDLKKLYFENKTLWCLSNYVIFLSSEIHWNKNNLLKLIKDAVHYTSESTTLAKKLYENFEIIFKDGSLIKSVSLENREDKPWIKLLKWTDGCILVPKILSNKALVSENTRYIYV
jgi:glycosyltransferase involved in cell wall biosynthesis